MNGEIIFPKKIPNLNHNLFNGVKILEFIKPNIKNTNDIESDQKRIFWLFTKGYKAIKKNTTKKTKPKLLFEFIFAFSFTNSY